VKRYSERHETTFQNGRDSAGRLERNVRRQGEWFTSCGNGLACLLCQKRLWCHDFVSILMIYCLARDLQHILPNTLKQRASSWSVRCEQIEQLHHDGCLVELFPCRIEPNPPLEITCEVVWLAEDLLGSQEFCEQGTPMGICVRASGTLVLNFDVLMQGKQVGILLIVLEQILRDIDCSLLVIEGEIGCRSFRAKYCVGDRNVCQNDRFASDDVAFNRVNQGSKFRMWKSEHRRT